jgi:hypothetical protein
MPTDDKLKAKFSAALDQLAKKKTWWPYTIKREGDQVTMKLKKKFVDLIIKQPSK